MPFRAAFQETFKLLGFAGPRDLMASALGLKGYTWAALKFYLAGATLTAVMTFCAQWLWNPPSALFILLFLDLANARYGYQVAKKLKGEPFRWDEFQRMGGKLIATIIVLGTIRNVINAYPYYDLISHLVFGWLFTTKMQKVLSKMVALKVSEEGLPRVLMAVLRGVLSSKFGPLLVDTIQNHKPATDESPASKPDEQP